MSEKINYDKSMDKEDPDIKVEIASMHKDCFVMLIDKGALPGGQPTLATRDVSPRDPDFIEICKTFHLNIPGDSYYKKYKLTEGKWCLVAEGENKR